MVVRAIKFYQRFISPLFSSHCRFYPSCSEYAVQSIEKHGIIKGALFSILRVSRCNPLSQGGVDIP